MSAHQPADEWQEMLEVELVTAPHHGRSRAGELEDDEASSGLEHTVNLAQTGIQVGEVADSKGDYGSSRGIVSQGQIQCIGDHRRDGLSLAFPITGTEHGLGEIGCDHLTAEAGGGGKLDSDVEGASAEVHVTTLRPSGPVQFGNCLPTPATIDVRAQQMIEQIVAGRDLAEHLAHVRALARSAGSGGTRFIEGGGGPVGGEDFTGGSSPTEVAGSSGTSQPYATEWDPALLAARFGRG